MKEITSIPLSVMPNGAHFDYVSDILSEAEACPAVVAKAKTQLDAFRQAVAAEDEVLKVMRKSGITGSIAQADAERDSLYNGMKTSVRAFLTMPIPEMQEAAKALTQLFKEYNINTSAQLNTETGMLINIIADLQGKYAAHVAALNLTPVVEKLKEANDRVRQYTKERTKERTTVNVGATKAARLATDEAYYMLVKMVNALALVYGEADYAGFIDYVNVQITQYKREVLKQTATKPATDGTTPDNPGEEPGGSETPGGSEEPETPGGSENPGGSGSGSGGEDDFV